MKPGTRVVVRQLPTAPKEAPEIRGKHGEVVEVTQHGYVRVRIDDWGSVWMVHPENLTEEGPCSTGSN